MNRKNFMLSQIPARLRKLANDIEALSSADIDVCSVELTMQVSGHTVDADTKLAAMRSLATNVVGQELTIETMVRSDGTRSLHVASRTPHTTRDQIEVGIYGGFNPDEPLPKALVKDPVPTYRFALDTDDATTDGGAR